MSAEITEEMVERAARALHAEFLRMDGPDQWIPDYDANPWVGAAWRERVRPALEAALGIDPETGEEEG